MSLRLETPLFAATLAALTLAACTDVNRDQPVDSFALAAFDPGVAGVRAANIPLPNDLALQGAPSQPPGVTREVLFSFIEAGGWPGDQYISIPVRTIVRDPETRAYVPSPTPPAGIDATTVNASTVAIVRVSDSPPTVLAPAYLGYGPRAGSPGFNEIRLRIAGSELMPPGRYVVALRAGERGVKTSDGQPIGADQIPMLLAPNMDLTNPENQPLGGLPEAQVASLERLRGVYGNPLEWSAVADEATCRQALGIPAEVPFPEGTCWLPAADPAVTPAYDAIDLVFPHDELASMQAFEIAAPAPIVDSANSVVPFPSDFLRLTGPVVRHPQAPAELPAGDPRANVVQGCEAVRLPGDVRPCMRNIASLGAAAPGIASLDGSSTTALHIAPLSSAVQASTITGENVLVYELTGAGPRRMTDVAGALGGGGDAEYLTQPPALVQNVGGVGVSTTIGLQPAVPVPVGDNVINLPPLKPKTTYIVMITDGVRDVANQPLARGTLGTLLFTVQTPIYDPTKPEGQRSNVPSLTEAEALGIQTLRTALRPLAQGIELQTGKKVVLGYTMTTQDVKKVSADLTALPYSVEQAAGGPFFTTAGVADYDTNAELGIPAAAFPNTLKFVAGDLATLDVMSSATGTLDPLLPTWGTAEFAAARHEVPMLVAVPKPENVAASCPPPAAALKCAPLVVFHHGLNGGRLQMLGIADALAAKGFVVAAIDAPFHGDRAYCEVNADCGGGGTCTLTADQKAPGTCSTGTLAFDAARLTTVASGNYFVSENFFRIRDAIRQDLLDQSALILAAATPRTTPDPLAVALGGVGVAVDPTRVYYGGTSLGGFIGTSLVATNPRVSRAAFNFGGATLTDVFTNAPAFRDDVEALFAELIPGFTFEQVTAGDPAFNPAVAQRYAQLLIVAKWVLDPAEPVNYAADVTTKDAASAALVAALEAQGLPITGAQVYGQMVEGDPVVPNAFNALLYENAGIPFTFYATTAVPADQRHGLLLGSTAASLPVKTHFADFLADPGTLPPAAFDLDAP